MCWLRWGLEFFALGRRGAGVGSSSNKPIDSGSHGSACYPQPSKGFILLGSLDGVG